MNKLKFLQLCMEDPSQPRSYGGYTLKHKTLRFKGRILAVESNGKLLTTPKYQLRECGHEHNTLRALNSSIQILRDLSKQKSTPHEQLHTK